jgi:DNA-binding transcriptional regulator YiaG
MALSKRGMTMLRAKRAVEEMLAKGRVVVRLPTVESQVILARELADAGCKAATLAAKPVDVQRLRRRLGYSQEQFALQYGLDVDAVRNWESHRRTPDPAAQNFLRVIERMPEQASAALEEAVEPESEAAFSP